MCGIAGYVGKKEAPPLILDMLKKLEYRGYDSAGISTLSGKKLAVVKCKGKITDLADLLKTRRLSGSLGIGHTRWATHGKPSRRNAHPHFDCSKRIAVVHNGIIENFKELKNKLAGEGCRFTSDTDTEVIAHLISRFYKYKGDLQGAVKRALKELKGSYALGVISLDEPDKIIACRKHSPLVIGLGKNENFIVSDVSAILNRTSRVIYLKDAEIAVITKDSVDLIGPGGRKVPVRVDKVSYSIKEAQLGGFPHFMLKEIHEQPRVLSRILSHYTSSSGNIKFEGLNLTKKYFRRLDNIIIVACGTAFHAGLVGKYILESYLRIPVFVDLGSEFRYRNPVIKKGSLIIAISQSGETADTLAAVREARKNKAKVLSVCNVLGSSLTRESDYVIHTYGGPEISVASTKAYTAQLLTLYLLGLYVASVKNTLTRGYIERSLKALKSIPSKQKNILADSKKIRAIARKHLHFGAFLYLGRNLNFPTALEGALKLKEISYIPSEGYSAGEMKHGPIALIDEYRAVICIINDSNIYDKMISNMQEILARQGKIIAIATEGNKKIKDFTREVIFVPRLKDEFSPLLTIVPLQLFAYYISVLKGYDVDKPRNLAKSVTVE